MAPNAIDLATLTVVAKVVVLVLGGMITGLAYRAAKRTGSAALRLFAIGFAVITLGALLGGVVHLFSSLDIRVGILAQSLLTAIGFTLLAYSLYATHLDTSEGSGTRPV
ncbi:MAG: hypothetical protein ABEH66_00295 [Halobacteriales archaeon]